MASVNEKMNGSGYTFTLKHVGTDRSKQEGTDDDWCTLAPGRATLTHSFTGTGIATNRNCSSSIPITVYSLEADVDNENRWGNNYFTDNYKTPRSRALRDQIGPYIGKVLFVNDIDKDGSGTPDFMDGWGCLTSQIPLLEREKAQGSSHRTVNPENRFVPMDVSLEGIPSSANTSTIRFRFDYPDSPPASMQRVTEQWNVGFDVNKLEERQFRKVISPTGYIRIWKKNGTEARNVATDYVRSNQTVMTYADLQSLSNPGRLYLEAINPSQDWSDIRIVVSLSVDGGSTWVSSNAVRVTSMRCNFTAAVVRQFYIDSSDGNRRLLIPDHSSPLTLIAGLERLLETKKAKIVDVRLQKGWGVGNPWWHDGDATLGHGFACFQYEGPTLGTTLSSRCSAVPNYDNKVFIGKTGAGEFWEYGDGEKNAQKALAWWDICPHKIENKFLVIKQTYTLHPERMSAMFSTFDDITRFNKFGLHIEPSINGWGCLSHVGLSMSAHQLDVDRMNECLFNKDMPSTLNKSVWDVVLGVVIGTNDPEEQYNLVRNGVRMLRRANASRGWGDHVDLQDASFQRVRRNFSRMYQGKPMVREWGTLIIGAPPSIPLNDATDKLRFYDPGRFPVVFGESPENVFDVNVN